MNEASNEGWSSRTLDRNVSTQYFYRLMQSPKKNDVVNEMLLKNSDEYNGWASPSNTVK